MALRRAYSLILLLVTACSALEPGLPSKTSILVAIVRAIGAKIPEPEFRNPDYLVGGLIGPRERAAVPNSLWPQLLDLGLDAVPERARPAIARDVRRTRYFDEVLIQALAGGVRQVVILGAGFDTRGYRFRDRLHHVRFFEVDYGPTQEYKKQRLIELFGTLPTHVRYVSMDFTRDDLFDRLSKSGYSGKDKTLFIWEGVVYYLPEPAVRQTFQFVRDHSTPGSEIAFDYYLSRHPWINNPKTPVARLGEPYIFGFPGNSATAFVRSQSLEVVSDMSFADADKKYLQHKGGSSPFPPDPESQLNAGGYCLTRVPDSGVRSSRQQQSPEKRF